MDVDKTLLKAALKLVKLLDKTADETLPQEIADIVKLHSKLAVGSAWIPVPGADVAAGAAPQATRPIVMLIARANAKIFFIEIIPPFYFFS